MTLKCSKSAKLWKIVQYMEGIWEVNTSSVPNSFFSRSRPIIRQIDDTLLNLLPGHQSGGRCHGLDRCFPRFHNHGASCGGGAFGSPATFESAIIAGPHKLLGIPWLALSQIFRPFSWARGFILKGGLIQNSSIASSDTAYSDFDSFFFLGNVVRIMRKKIHSAWRSSARKKRDRGI